VSYVSAFAMWLAMTGVMMAPVVFPWLRALGRVAEGRAGGPAKRESEATTVTGGITSVVPFAAGYAAAWAGFSAAAAGVQVSVLSLGVPVPFGLDAPVLSAAALFLAGFFQFTGLKDACLSHCRSPAGYLLTHWREGAASHARLGFGHGLHCVGCCWALMALALVVGMIDLVWMGLLMAVMVAETTLPFGGRLPGPIGIALIVAGGVVLAA